MVSRLRVAGEVQPQWFVCRECWSTVVEYPAVRTFATSLRRRVERPDTVLTSGRSCNLALPGDTPLDRLIVEQLQAPSHTGCVDSAVLGGTKKKKDSMTAAKKAYNEHLHEYYLLVF